MPSSPLHLLLPLLLLLTLAPHPSTSAWNPIPHPDNTTNTPKLHRQDATRSSFDISLQRYEDQLCTMPNRHSFKGDDWPVGVHPPVGFPDTAWLHPGRRTTTDHGRGRCWRFPVGDYDRAADGFSSYRYWWVWDDGEMARRGEVDPGLWEAGQWTWFRRVCRLETFTDQKCRDLIHTVEQANHWDNFERCISLPAPVKAFSVKCEVVWM